MTVEKKHERGQWGSQVEFLLSCLGYDVGLGNIWRFPYLAYANGGGAFLIPYWLSLLLVGLPLFFMELALGQYSSLGPSGLFARMSPLFAGIGWGMVVCSALVCIYYNMIIAWVIFYLFDSFRANLRWTSCTNHWNTWLCYSKRETELCEEQLGNGSRFFNQSCWNASMVEKNNIHFAITNFSEYMNDPEIRLKSPADEYFHNYMLEISDSFENSGGLSWKLVLCLLGAWVLVCVCLIKGVQSTGKVVYFTATFPYVVLVILLIRGATLEGALDGILFFIKPNFKRLGEMKVWSAAATQIFYSLGPAFGGLITMSSYNPFKSNCYRVALIVAIGDSVTSLFAGFVVFSVVGFMAQDLQVPIENVTASGPGLAFVVYPEALSRMPIGPFWSVIFFLMLITLGLDSEFAMLETCTTAFMDQFPILRKYKSFVVCGTCVAMFLLGLPMCTKGGFYVFTLMNDYSAGWCLVILGLAELLVVSYAYGYKRFLKDICAMLGFEPTWYWKATWLVISPAFLVFILISSFIDYAPSSYRGYNFSPLAESLGILVALSSVICIPIFAFLVIVKYRREDKGVEDVGWSMSICNKIITI